MKQNDSSIDQVGGYLVQLADDTSHGMWWVVGVRLDQPLQVLAGFRHGRRADARHLFDHVTEDELDQGLDRSRRDQDSEDVRHG